MGNGELNGGNNGNGYSGGNGAARVSSFYGSLLQSVTVVALFVAGFWAGVIVPLQNAQHDSVTKSEFLEFKQRMDEHNKQLVTDVVPRNENDRAWKDLDQRLSSTEHGLSSTMTRDEIVSRLENHTQQTNSLRTDLTDLTKEIGRTYNVGDQVKSMQLQIDDLRKALENKADYRLIPVSPATK